MANQPTPDGIMKNRVRRMADRQGLTVRARRIKDRNARNYGRVELIDEKRERVIPAAGFTWESIELYLRSSRARNCAGGANPKAPGVA